MKLKTNDPRRGWHRVRFPSGRMEKDLEFWLSFHAIPGFKADHFGLLKSGFDSWAKAWNASTDNLDKVGIPKSIINHIVSKRLKQNPEEQLEKLDRYGAKT